MSTLTIALPDALEVALAERMKAAGAHSKEEYLLGLVESDCVAGQVEEVLAQRMDGPFAPLEADWKDRVRSLAVKDSPPASDGLRSRKSIWQPF